MEFASKRYCPKKIQRADEPNQACRVRRTLDLLGKMRINNNTEQAADRWPLGGCGLGSISFSIAWLWVHGVSWCDRGTVMEWRAKQNPRIALKADAWV
jgi:hypothetical protein